MTTPYTVPTADDILVDEVRLPCGTAVRYGDEIQVTGFSSDPPDVAWVAEAGQVFRIDAETLSIWPPIIADDGEDAHLTFPYDAIEHVAVIKRNWRDPLPGHIPMSFPVHLPPRIVT